MFINDPIFKWEKQHQEDAVLFYKGSKKFAVKTQDICKKADIQKNLTAHLKTIDDFSSGLIETKDHIIAWVDHIRSWPLFFTKHNDEFIISNNARLVKEKAGLIDTDRNSCLEFAMSGYVSGGITLLKNLACLQPGEFLIWNKKEKSLTLTRYYQYIPDMRDNTQTREENKKTLGIILDDLTKKIIQSANGRHY